MSKNNLIFFSGSFSFREGAIFWLSTPKSNHGNVLLWSQNDSNTPEEKSSQAQPSIVYSRALWLSIYLHQTSRFWSKALQREPRSWHPTIFFWAFHTKKLRCPSLSKENLLGEASSYRYCSFVVVVDQKAFAPLPPSFEYLSSIFWRTF